MTNDPNTHRAVEFTTVPLTNREADALYTELGNLDDVLNVYLSGDDGDTWEGAVLPGDTSDLSLLAIVERLREIPRVSRASVQVGTFPSHAIEGP